MPDWDEIVSKNIDVWGFVWIGFVYYFFVVVPFVSRVNIDK